MVSIEWLNSLESDRKKVGDKAFYLNKVSDFSRELDFSIPQGFVLTKGVMEYFLDSNNLRSQIVQKIENLDKENYRELKRASEEIQDLILNADLPEEVEEGIKEAYEKIGLSGEVRNAGGEAVDLVGSQRESQFVAVRSSIPEEFDICDTFLNINGKNSVLRNIKKCYASLFSPEALYYYENPLETGMAVLIQRMLEPEKSASLFTRNPCTGDSSQMVVESVWGIGNSLSSGDDYPDYYQINKESGNLDEKNIVGKGWEFKINSVSGELVKEKVPQDKKYKKVLSNDELSDLAKLGIKLEEKFKFEKIDVSIRRGKIRILDMEKRDGSSPNVQEVDEEPFLKGRGASPGIGKGEINLVYDDSDQDSIKEKDIIVTLNPKKEFIPSLNRISGFIAEEGSLSSDLAFVARKLGIPVIVGAKKATDILTPEEIMNIDGTSGQIFEESEVKREEAVQEVKSYSQIRTGGITATDLKVASSQYNPQAEGTLVPEDLDRDKISDLAKSYDPLPVWLRQSPRSQSSEYDPWGPTESTDLTNIAENLGFIADLDNLNDIRDCDRRGVIIEDFASVMQLEDVVNRIDLAVIDVSSLAETSGKSYDHPALNNAIQKMVNICKDNCECSIYLKKADPSIIRKAIEQGIDSITVTPEELSKAKQLIAKEEKRFMMNKLRRL